MFKVVEKYLSSCALEQTFDDFNSAESYVNGTIEKIKCFWVALTGKQRDFTIAKLTTAKGHLIVQVMAPEYGVYSTKANMYVIFRIEKLQDGKDVLQQMREA